jgi:hypothetical protein
MSASDTCRKYFDNIGSETELVDESKLVASKTAFLKELALIDAEIAELNMQMKLKKDDSKAYLRERGVVILFIYFIHLSVIACSVGSSLTRWF